MLKTIQIHFLEILVSLLGKVNAGIDRAQEVINSAMDGLQSRATKALNDRLDRLADDLLVAAGAAVREPYRLAADYERKLESLTREYEARKDAVEFDRSLVLSQHNLAVAQETADAYLAERLDILNRMK